MFKLAYNAGHIYATPGKRLPKEIDPKETREWVLNDRVARYFAEEMSKYENVELHRMDDPKGVKEIDIEMRVANANTWGADFYLSIHHNAAGKVFSGGGAEVYIDGSGGESEKYAKAIYDALIDATGLKGNRADPLRSAEDGVRLYECRATKMPAVLVECGFMDSTVDAPIILTEDFAKKAGVAIAQAIAKQAGLKLKQSEKTSKYFNDVKASDWYADSVDYCRENGLMNGVTDTEFVPDRQVTRAELAVVIARLHKQTK